MNRSSNLLNGALLGSSGSSSRVYIYATQWCEAQATALLRRGRQLHIQSTAAVNSTVILRGALKLKSATQATSVITAKLAGFTAVNLSALVEASLSSNVVLQSLRPKALQFAVAVGIQTTAVLRRLHPEYLSSNTNMVGNGQCVLNIGKLLKASYVLTVATTAVLSESTKVRAPVARIARIPNSSRVVFIQGSK